MKHLITRVRAHVDLIRGDRLRRRAGTHLIEEMGRHPEQVRDLADPVADETYWDIAEQLLNDGLADVVEKNGWMR